MVTPEKQDISFTLSTIVNLKLNFYVNFRP